MRPRGIHLQYAFDDRGQRGAEVQNPLFDLLMAVREHGSIRHAATALGASYRYVWGQLKHWETVLGEPVVSWVQGQPARLTPFAERLLWAERRARTRLTPHIEALRAELERVLTEACDGSQEVLTLFASHDLALPRLREIASQVQSLHVDLRFDGSVDGLRALAAGRCVVAGFHVPRLPNGSPVFAQALKRLLKPGLHKLIGCMQRTQGLIVARDNPLDIASVADLAVPGVRFVNRQRGSGTRLLMDHLLDVNRVQAAAVDGYLQQAEESHVAVAALIASGQADAGPGIEAAAREFSLGFIPLLTEDYFLVCLKESLDQAPVQRLLAVLRSPAWAAEVEARPGYAVSRAGEVLTLTKALPWWNFRTPKAGRPAASPAVATPPNPTAKKRAPPARRRSARALP